MPDFKIDIDEGSGREDEITSSMIEIEELGSPIMERLSSFPSEPILTKTVHETQTIRLLAGSCIPRCLHNLPKCQF